jgi:hypothetical protein
LFILKTKKTRNDSKFNDKPFSKLTKLPHIYEIISSTKILNDRAQSWTILKNFGLYFSSGADHCPVLVSVQICEDRSLVTGDLSGQRDCLKVKNIETSLSLPVKDKEKLIIKIDNYAIVNFQNFKRIKF